MAFTVTIDWQIAQLFSFPVMESWYYVYFDNAYFQQVFWDGYWFYEDENKEKMFKYVHEIQFFAIVPEIPTPKINARVEDFEDCFPSIFKNR